MPPSEIRREARESLRGKWGKAVCIVLAYMLITIAIGFVEKFFESNSFLYLLIELAVLIISVPLSFGLIISYLKLKRGEDVKAFDFLSDGFNRFGKSWGIAWHTFVRMLLPIICIVLVAILMAVLAFTSVETPLLALAGVVLYIATLIYTVSRSFLYVIAYQISYDNPELYSKDCVNKSEELMRGNRGNYFLLQLSFIGWAILACFTLGIGLLWLAPYIAVAEMCFYDRVAKTEVKKIDEEIKIEE